LVRGEAVEVVLLLDPLGWDPVLGAQPVDEVGLALELLAADAVQARIDVLVDVPLVVDPLQELLDEPLVALVGRADEEVVLGIYLPRKLAPVLDDVVDVRLRIETLLPGDALDLPGRLVRAGQQDGLVAPLAMVSHERNARDRRVGVPDVRRRIDVVDGCPEVEPHRRQ
jgi:hypothetical protein